MRHSYLFIEESGGIWQSNAITTQDIEAWDSGELDIVDMEAGTALAARSGTTLRWELIPLYQNYIGLVQ